MCNGLNRYVLFFFVLQTSFSAWSKPIRVTPGDTLSKIAQAYKKNDEHIYGKNGLLERLIALNPHIKNPHHIHAGTLISLPLKNQTPIRQAASTEAPVESLSSNETAMSVQAPDESSEAMTSETISSTHATAPLEVAPAPHIQKAAQEAERVMPKKPKRKKSKKPFARNPDPEVMSSESENLKDIQFDLGLEFVYARIDAKDISSQAKAKYISDLMERFRFSLAMEVFPDLFWRTEFFIQKNKYLPPNSGVEFNNSPDIKQGQISLEKRWKSGLSARFFAGIGQQVFVRRISVSQYTWDVASVPFTGVGLSYDFLRSDRHTLQFSADISRLSAGDSGTQQLDSGLHYEAGLVFKTRKKNFIIQQQLGGSQRAQNSEIVEQKSTELLLGIGLGYLF